MAISAMEAAKIACQESGWELSNLQLHKILYIAGMVYAGKHGNPLINNEYFEAWKYGPVLPSVYNAASIYGSDSIKSLGDKRVNTPVSCPEYQEIATAVNRLKNVPPFRLVEFTHSPIGAWKHRYDIGHNQPILNEDMMDEFRRRVSSQ